MIVCMCVCQDLHSMLLFLGVLSCLSSNRFDSATWVFQSSCETRASACIKGQMRSLVCRSVWLLYFNSTCATVVQTPNNNSRLSENRKLGWLTPVWHVCDGIAAHAHLPKQRLTKRIRGSFARSGCQTCSRLISIRGDWLFMICFVEHWWDPFKVLKNHPLPPVLAGCALAFGASLHDHRGHAATHVRRRRPAGGRRWAKDCVVTQGSLRLRFRVGA